MPSTQNETSEPSQKWFDLDCKLAQKAWPVVLGINAFSAPIGSIWYPWVQVDRGIGAGILYLTTRPGFSLGSKEKAFLLLLHLLNTIFIYLFPPFVLFGLFFASFLIGISTVCSRSLSQIFIIRPRQFWRANLEALAVDQLLLDRKGSDSVLFFPSRHPREWLGRCLKWDLWAFRFVFTDRASL